MPEPGSLQDLVRARLAVLGLSYERAALRSGGLVSHGTLHRLANGTHQGRLRAATVRGVAFALGVDEAEIRRWVPGRPALETPFTLPPRASELDFGDRRLVVDYVDRLLRKSRRLR